MKMDKHELKHSGTESGNKSAVFLSGLPSHLKIVLGRLIAESKGISETQFEACDEAPHIHHCVWNLLLHDCDA